MRRSARIGLVTVLASMALIWGASTAWAGSPHFVSNTVSCTSSFDSSTGTGTLTCSGKEAGLGDELQVHIEVTATAECINGGGNHPKAVNKESVSGGGDFPVQNGKAEFSVTLTASFQPPCSPPMTVQWVDVTVADTTNGISVFFKGPI